MHEDYDLARAMAEDHSQNHWRAAHDDKYGQGAHEHDFPWLYQGSVSDGSMTDGKIVGQCPGCLKPIRKHQTAHGDELRHLHNNHVRCFGKTAGGADLAADAEGANPAGAAIKALDLGGKALNGIENELEKPADLWAYRAQSALQMYAEYFVGDGKKDYPLHCTTCGQTFWSKTPVSEAFNQHVQGHVADYGWDHGDVEHYVSPHPMDHMGVRYTADYLGRPDASNPTGRGPDEYKARTWNAYETTHPMQSPDDRGVNTPVLPAEPLKTRNINTPTRGLRGREDDLQHPDDDEDDED